MRGPGGTIGSLLLCGLPHRLHDKRGIPWSTLRLCRLPYHE